MLRFKELSLNVQLPALAAGSVFIVSLCLLWLAVTSSDYLQQERDRLYGESLARQIAAAVSEPLQRGDLLSARASLQRFIDQSLADGVSIRDVEGMPIGTAGNLASNPQQEYRADIRIADDTAGEVLLSLDGSVGRESRWRFLFSLLALAVALSLLVFMGARSLAQRLSSSLLALQSQLTLPTMDAALDERNELTRLQRTAEQLPMDMLRANAKVPAAATEFRQGSILFVHMASLVRYVDTLSESNLHRYTRRLQQILQAAAQCYRGQLVVSRPFGLLISFDAQPNAGSEALRAASCARLISLIASGLKSRTSLSLELCMALGQCEQVAEEVDDVYPRLYLQGAIEELQDVCLSDKSHTGVFIDEAALRDEQLGSSAAVRSGTKIEGNFVELLSLSEEQENLLAHQAQLIIERIHPAPNQT